MPDIVDPLDYRAGQFTESLTDAEIVQTTLQAEQADEGRRLAAQERAEEIAQEVAEESARLAREANLPLYPEV